MRNWNGKPYHSLDYMLRETFGEKVYKVTLNGGMSCPNRDGKLGSRGCIFCSEGGSGDFAADAALTITEQIDSQIAVLSAKRPIHKYIAYFQAYTNTYAPVEYLRKIFTEAIHHPAVVALSIGTRPDCLGEDVLDLLTELNQIKPVWIELGLQTIHERTAAYIRRGYPLSVFETAVRESSGTWDRSDRSHDPGASGGIRGGHPRYHGIFESQRHTGDQTSASPCAERHRSCTGISGGQIPRIRKRRIPESADPVSWSIWIQRSSYTG